MTVSKGEEIATCNNCGKDYTDDKLSLLSEVILKQPHLCPSCLEKFDI